MLVNVPWIDSSSKVSDLETTVSNIGKSCDELEDKISMNRTSYAYTTTDIGINGKDIKYQSGTTAGTSKLSVTVSLDTFNDDADSAMLVVYGKREVDFLTLGLGKLIKQSSMLTTGSSDTSYRIYAFSYIGGTLALDKLVAVNCAEYNK